MLSWIVGRAHGQTDPLDAVRVYLVPLSDFPEDLAGALARALQENLRFRVKASLALPPLPVSTLPGTNQLADADLLLQATQASAHLPEATPNTYRVFLTGRDINSRTGNLRFVFSAHNKILNSSVVSLARLLEYQNDKPVLTDLGVARLFKMTKRAIGEIHLGWSRSTNPRDLMFAPIMGIGDLDRIGFEHAVEPRRDEKPMTPSVRGGLSV
jgi:predicted Zn-dependent protease